jgi:hypothetical protein
VAALIRSLPARPADAEVADVPAAEREALAAEWAKLDRAESLRAVSGPR